MAENKTTMEMLLATENKGEAEQINDFVQTLNTGEQARLLIFLEGVRFARNTATQKTA